MDTFQLGEIEIVVTRKDVKNVHLSVHPPEGRVTLVAPARTRLDVLRAYAITRLSWIRKQRAAFTVQARAARTNRSTQHWIIEVLQAGEIVLTGTAFTALRRETWSLDEEAMPQCPPPQDTPHGQGPPDRGVAYPPRPDQAAVRARSSRDRRRHRRDQGMCP